MIQTGVRCNPDHRDYSHTKTFGSITSFPEEFNTDLGVTNPNQNAEGLPFGCTGYTQAEVCSDQDGTIYKPSYTYLKTQMMEGTTGQNIGCDIRDSLKSTNVYGVQALNENNDLAAFTSTRLLLLHRASSRLLRRHPICPHEK